MDHAESRRRRKRSARGEFDDSLEDWLCPKHMHPGQSPKSPSQRTPERVASARSSVSEWTPLSSLQDPNDRATPPSPGHSRHSTPNPIMGTAYSIQSSSEPDDATQLIKVQDEVLKRLFLASCALHPSMATRASSMPATFDIQSQTGAARTFVRTSSIPPRNAPSPLGSRLARGQNQEANALTDRGALELDVQDLKQRARGLKVAISLLLRDKK